MFMYAITVFYCTWYDVQWATGVYSWEISTCISTLVNNTCKLKSIYNDYLSPGFSDQKDSQDAGEPRELNTEEEDDEEMSAEKDKK